MLKIFPGLHPDPLKQSLGVGIRSMRAREYSETILLQGKTWEPLCENAFHQLCVECDARRCWFVPPNSTTMPTVFHVQ